MKPPEVLPEFQAEHVFWTRLTRFALFVAAASIVSSTVLRVERNAAEIILEKI